MEIIAAPADEELLEATSLEQVAFNAGELSAIATKLLRLMLELYGAFQHSDRLRQAWAEALESTNMDGGTTELHLPKSAFIHNMAALIMIPVCCSIVWTYPVYFYSGLWALGQSFQKLIREAGKPLPVNTCLSCSIANKLLLAYSGTAEDAKMFFKYAMNRAATSGVRDNVRMTIETAMVEGLVGSNQVLRTLSQKRAFLLAIPCKDRMRLLHMVSRPCKLDSSSHHLKCLHSLALRHWFSKESLDSVLATTFSYYLQGRKDIGGWCDAWSKSWLASISEP